MSFKVSFGLLLRLAVLLAVFLAQSGEGATYQDFERQHINHPETRAPNRNAYCDRLMRQRGLTRRSCKATNTFIIARHDLIRNICRGQGRNVNRNIFESHRRFRIVTCRNRGRFPRCRYVGRQRTSKVRVGCVNRLPVHYAGP